MLAINNVVDKVPVSNGLIYKVIPDEVVRVLAINKGIDPGIVTAQFKNNGILPELTGGTPLTNNLIPLGVDVLALSKNSLIPLFTVEVDSVKRGI